MPLRCVRDRSNRSISIYDSVRCRSNVWRGLGTCRRRMGKGCTRGEELVRMLEVGSKTFEVDRDIARWIEISRDRSKVIRERFGGGEGVRDMFRVLWELDAELLRVVTELEARGGRINLPLSEILTVLSHCMDIDERRNRRMSKDEW